MKTIISIDLNTLKNEEHLQFHLEVKKLIDNQTPKMLQVEDLYPGYVTAFITENAALQKEKGGDIPQIIINADSLRNQAYEELVLLQKTDLKSKDPSVKDAAQSIGRIFAKYGDVMALEYREKSAAILLLNNEIKRNLSTELKVLGGEPYLIYLNELNEKFMGVFCDHQHDKQVMNSIHIRGARETIDPIYLDIKTRINALAYVKDDGFNNEFIFQLNSIINGYQPQLTARKSRFDQRSTKKEKRHLDLSQQRHPSPF